jgi:hypothetical protein
MGEHKHVLFQGRLHPCGAPIKTVLSIRLYASTSRTAKRVWMLGSLKKLSNHFNFHLDLKILTAILYKLISM